MAFRGWLRHRTQCASPNNKRALPCRADSVFQLPHFFNLRDDVPPLHGVVVASGQCLYTRGITQLHEGGIPVASCKYGCRYKYIACSSSLDGWFHLKSCLAIHVIRTDKAKPFVEVSGFVAKGFPHPWT